MKAFYLTTALPEEERKRLLDEGEAPNNPSNQNYHARLMECLSTFLDLATIHPLDEDAIARAYRRIGKALIVQDTPLPGSVGESVLRVISGLGMKVDARLVSALDMPVPVSKELESSVFPDREAVLKAAFSLGL